MRVISSASPAATIRAAVSNGEVRWELVACAQLVRRPASSLAPRRRLLSRSIRFQSRNFERMSCGVPCPRSRGHASRHQHPACPRPAWAWHPIHSHLRRVLRSRTCGYRGCLESEGVGMPSGRPPRSTASTWRLGIGTGILPPKTMGRSLAQLFVFLPTQFSELSPTR